MSEPAGIWLRVSTNDQDEANQAPDLAGWVANHRYTVARRYELRGRSASKGEQQVMLDQMLADMRAGIISVLVVWAADRIERRGALSALTLADEVRQAGGRIEYVKDTYLNEVNDMADVMLSLAANTAQRESARKADRVKAAHNRIRANDSFIGRAPWGYEIVGERYAKQLVATDAGKRLVPEIFARVIKGDSLATIAEWLEGETGRSWFPRRLGLMIRNPIYRGSQMGANGRVIYRSPALVDAHTWRLAGKALDTRPKRGPGNAENRALLAEILFCGHCADNGVESPMYRVRGGRHGQYLYYRCTGRGATRKGCGNLLRVATVDGIVGMLSRLDKKPIMEYQLVPGIDHKTELDEITFRMQELFTKDLRYDEQDRQMAELRAERDRVKELPTVPDRWEGVETNETYADMWRRLSVQERGNWLRSRGMRVRAVKGHVEILDSQGITILEYRSPRPPPAASRPTCTSPQPA